MSVVAETIRRWSQSNAKADALEPSLSKRFKISVKRQMPERLSLSSLH